MCPCDIYQHASNSEGFIVDQTDQDSKDAILSGLPKSSPGSPISKELRAQLLLAYHREAPLPLTFHGRHGRPRDPEALPDREAAP